MLKEIMNMKFLFFASLVLLGTFICPGIMSAQTLKLDYDVSQSKKGSDVISDVSGNKNDGVLKNGAIVTSFMGHQVVDFGFSDGYIDLGPGFGSVVSGLKDFSVFAKIFVPYTTDISGNGNFLWAFANTDNLGGEAKGGLFFSIKNTKYSISPTNWTKQSSLETGRPLVKGNWKTVAVTQQNKRVKIYIDGELVKERVLSMTPAELGNTGFNFIGRSTYRGDVYLKALKITNFKIYDGALNQNTIKELSADLNSLNAVINEPVVKAVLENLTIKGKDAVVADIELRTELENGVKVAWESENTTYISNDGKVTRPENGAEPAKVAMIANASLNGAVASKKIEVTVMPSLTDKESVQADLSNLSISGNTSNARSLIYLPKSGREGSVITWKSKEPDYITNEGKVLKLSPLGEGKKKVVITATVTKGKKHANKDFTAYVAEKEDKVAYLFTYFTGNAPKDEQIKFALSLDGFNFTPLNNGEPVIASKDIAKTGCVRDPHILRGADGKTFYMVVTDMRSELGWSSNRGMVLLKSEDLVHWTSSAIHFPIKWPEKWGNVTRVWAPQTIYDPVAKKYMVYFSLRTSADGSYDKIYYCYANEDFTDLEGEPVFLFDRGSATIDGDIVFNESDNLYHMVFKNEGMGGLCQVMTKTLTAPAGQEPGSQWSAPTDNVEQTNEAVEGAGTFRMIDSDDWVLMYDCYGSGHYQFCKSKDLQQFRYVKDIYDMDARHGTVMSITLAEAERLMKAFPSDNMDKLEIVSRTPSLKNVGLIVNDDAKTITVSVGEEVDLSSFDPSFDVTPGFTSSLSGEQDFSKGSVNYTFTNGSKKETYAVEVQKIINPIIPDFHADPEVLYSEKTGKFYIYPTTDGYPGWGGFTFDVFESEDLVHWENKGTILNLKTDQVSWASGNAWAPCIIEKKNAAGEYKYYFYFSGESGGKKIGVAIADSPTGPFKDLGHPMISDRPKGVSGGQQIDGDVFQDPVSGKCYFYYGNGYMAGAQLNDDMTSIDESTIKVLTPKGGTLETYAYREGTYVFYRNGKYYFLWSVDDTGAANYHVAYGTSDSPLGPIKVADDPVIIIQDPANKIYGSAHNSILQIPGKDEWYIVYHRINKDFLKNGPGTHREVCIDRMYFNEDGTIQKIVPTHKGVDPVKVK